VVIGDNSALQILGYGDVIINTTKFGDVPHVLGVESTLIYMYCIRHTNKMWKFSYIEES